YLVALLQRDSAERDAAVELFRQKAVESKDARGEKHPEHAVRLMELATLTRERTKMEPLAEAAARIFLEKLEPTDLDYAPHLLQTGLMLWRTRSRAETVTLKAAAIFRECGRDRHRGYAGSLDYLASIYMQVGGRPAYAQAEPILKELLEI